MGKVPRRLPMSSSEEAPSSLRGILFHDDNEIKQATKSCRIWTACHKNSIWLASKSFLIDVTNILLLTGIVLKNKTKILFVPFVRHIELQNFLIAPRSFVYTGLCRPILVVIAICATHDYIA